jgi:uncharacterized membrane protein YedE/YeeE
MMELISNTWPWYVSGVIVSLTLFFLIWFGKEFGTSANLRVFVAMVGGKKFSDFFDFPWKTQMWNVMFAVGAAIGGYFTMQFIAPAEHFVGISEATVNTLNSDYGFNLTYGQVPLLPEFFESWESVLTLKGFIIIVVGGILVGFGARYAGGCTSGMAISGISNLQLPSLVAVIGFFIGGLIMVNYILPYILTL